MMNKHEARQLACRMASGCVEMLRIEGIVYINSPGISDENAALVEQELESIAQHLWERGNPETELSNDE